MEHSTSPIDKRFRIFIKESQLGHGVDFWTEDFLTEAEAWERIHSINGRNVYGQIPEYYMIAEQRVEVVFPGLVPGL